MPASDPPPPPGERLTAALGSARAQLENRVREINDLNVFPVPDGDTGTNLLQSVQAIERAGAELAGTSFGDRCEALARAALLGARGNSGMILSQMVRGAADAIAERGTLDAAAVVSALRGASDTAYRAVREPVEGTMLTLIRAMADGAERGGAGDIEGAFAAALDAGRISLAETRELLPQLKEAGVVDSGAYGVLLITEGLAAALAGHHVGPAISVAAPTVVPEEHEPSAFRYCTTFIVDGSDVELDVLEGRLAPLGDSLFVIGDRRQAKVHVHTDEPREAIALGEQVGVVSGVNIDDMHRQEAARAARIERRVRAARVQRTGALDRELPLAAGTTAVVTDSGSDLPPGRRDEHTVVVPVPISFGTEAFLDGVDLPHEEFYARLVAGGDMPTTAAPSMGELVAAYSMALDRHEFAVGLHMGGTFSSTVEIARRAALEVDPDRIVILETEAISFQLGLLVTRVQALLAQGTTLGGVQDAVDHFRRTQGTVFTVETLEFLQRGGRIGKGRALVGNLLGLRPLLEVRDGEVVPVRRVRGSDRMLPAMRAFLEERSSADRPLHVGLAHARNAAAIPALEAMVREARPLAVVELVAEKGPTVGTHTGPGSLAITFVHDPLEG